MPATINKTNRTSLTGKKAEAESLVVDYEKSSIVLKTMRMAETLKKYPRPAK